MDSCDLPTFDSIPPPALIRKTCYKQLFFSGAGSDCGSPTVDDFDDDDMAHSEELGQSNLIR